MLNSPFGVETPEDSPGFLLWQATVVWQRMIKKALDEYDVSHAQFVILAILLWYETHQEQPTQVLIATQSKLDKMTVSKSLRKLVMMGWVKRREDEKDTRAKNVTLTSQGKSLAHNLVQVVEKVDTEFFGRVSPVDQKSLTKILGKLIPVEKV